MAEELSDLSAVAETDEIEVKIEPHNLSQYHAKREEFNLAEVKLNFISVVSFKSCDSNYKEFL